jgi:hypothetical protein
MTARHRRRESAWVAYFKGLMHAADARCCVESENWIPAAVSLYYAVFDLTVASILASGYNPNVRRGQNGWVTLDSAIDQGAEDPYRLVRHHHVCEFVRQEGGSEYIVDLEQLRDLREFASYRPSIRILEDGRTLVNVCEIDAGRFIRTVRQEVGRLEMHFQFFRDYLYGQERTSPNQPTNSEVTCWLIESHAEDAIRELGRYRSERATEIAQEIHRSAFLGTR